MSFNQSQDFVHQRNQNVVVNKRVITGSYQPLLNYAQLRALQQANNPQSIQPIQPIQPIQLDAEMYFQVDFWQLVSIENTFFFAKRNFFGWSETQQKPNCKSPPPQKKWQHFEKYVFL